MTMGKNRVARGNLGKLVIGLASVAVVAAVAVQWLRLSVEQQMQAALADYVLEPAADQSRSVKEWARLEAIASAQLVARGEPGTVREEATDRMASQVPEWFHALIINRVPETRLAGEASDTVVHLTADPQAYLGRAWSWWLGVTLGAAVVVLLALLFGRGQQPKPARRRSSVWAADSGHGTETPNTAAEQRTRTLGVTAETDPAALERLPERMADAVIVCDTNGVIQYANEQAHRLFEYESDDLAGRAISRLVPPWIEGHAPDAFAGVPDSTQDGAWVEHEARRLTRRGQLIDVSIACAPLDESGLNPQGQVYVIRDISRVRQRTEKAQLVLRAGDQLQDGLLVIETSADHRVAYANEAARKLLPLDDETLTGQPFGPTASCLNRDLEAYFAEVVHSATPQTQWLPVAGDEAEHTYEFSMAPVLSSESARVTHLVVVVRDVTERHSHYQALKNDQQWLSQLLRDNPQATCITDAEDRITATNPVFDELFGQARTREAELGLDALIPRESLAQAHEALAGATEFRCYVAFPINDEERTAELKVVRLEQQERFLWFFYDVTERLATARQLAAETERAKVTLASIGDSVVTTNAQGIIDYINPVAESLTGVSRDDALGLPADQVIHFREEDTDEPISSPLTRALRLGRTLRVDRQALLRDGTGTDHAVQLTAAPIRDRSGDIIGGVLTFHDVTEMRRTARRLAYEARHDALTGLLNKREFYVRLEDALDTARYDNMAHVIGYFDLDYFKAVNDTVGHTAGDELLKQLTERIKSNLRRTDLMARIGGDEFAVLFYGCTLDDARGVGEAIVQSVEQFRFQWGELQFEVGVSAGLVAMTSDTASVERALEEADEACYQSKNSGRGQVCVAGDLHHEESERWAERLARAVSEDRFTLCQQVARPLNDRGGGYREMLLRLKDEDTGQLLPPERFFPAARRHGFVQAIDEWVIGNVFDWLAQSGHGGSDQIGINLSITTLGDPGFAEFIIQQWRRTGVDPQRIVFELDEPEVITRLSSVKTFAERLHEHGFGFALQKFTFSRASFDFLRELPLAYLKLDGSLCADLESQGEAGRVMVASVARIAHLAGVNVIAAEVADQRVVEALADLGLVGIQGHAISRPEQIV